MNARWALAAIYLTGQSRFRSATKLAGRDGNRRHRFFLELSRVADHPAIPDRSPTGKP